MQTPAAGASILKSKMPTLLQNSFHRSGQLAFENAYLSRPGSCPVKPKAPITTYVENESIFLLHQFNDNLSIPSLVYIDGWLEYEQPRLTYNNSNHIIH